MLEIGLAGSSSGYSGLVLFLLFVHASKFIFQQIAWVTIVPTTLVGRTALTMGVITAEPVNIVFSNFPILAQAM